MNIFSKVTLQGLKKNRTRTIVTIVGVILSAAMIMAVTSFISSLQNFLLQTAIVQHGDWHGKLSDVDYDAAQKLDGDSEVESAALIQNIGYALLEGGQNKDKPYLFVAGFSDEAFDILPVKLSEGRLPQANGEIVIPEHVATNGGVEYRLGDTLTLAVGSRALEGEKLNQNNPYNSGESEDSVPENFTPEETRTFTVVGFYMRPTFESISAPGYTAITKMEPAQDGSYDAYFKLKSARNIYAFVQEQGEKVGVKLNSEYLRAAAVSSNDSYNAVLYSLGSILIALIMVGSILLIYNAFSISVSERTRQFGILSSVGATKKQLRKSVLFEGLCIGIIGIPLGVLAGVGGIGVTLKFVDSIIHDMIVAGVPLTLSVSPIAVIVTVLSGIAVILISAYIPAKRASKRSAIESIRQTDDVKITARSVKTSKLTAWLFGLSGMLASKNFKRNKRRYRATIISLFVSVVLLISASAFGLYLKQGTEMSFAVSDYDIAFIPTQMKEGEVIRLYQKLKNAGGVYDSGYQLNANFLFDVPTGLLTEKFKTFFLSSDDGADMIFRSGFSLSFVDDATYMRYLRDLGLSADEYTGDGAKFPAVAKIQGYDSELQRVVSFDMFKESGIIDLKNITYDEPDADQANPAENPGKSVKVMLSQQVPMGFSQAQHGGLRVFAPYSMKDQFDLPKEQGDMISLIFMSDDPMKTTAEMEGIIKAENISVNGYTLYNAAEMQEANRNILLVINVFTYGFIILMSLVTIANVFNTISTSINLRRREFAMLRSVGMSDQGFNKMMVYECILYGIKALLYGLPASIGITFLIYTSLNAGVDMAFTLPWESIGISVLGVFCVVFVTMLYSVSKIKKENTVDALKSDMM